MRLISGGSSGSGCGIGCRSGPSGAMDPAMYRGLRFSLIAQLSLPAFRFLCNLRRQLIWRGAPFLQNTPACNAVELKATLHFLHTNAMLAEARLQHR